VAESVGVPAFAGKKAMEKVAEVVSFGETPGKTLAELLKRPTGKADSCDETVTDASALEVDT